MKLKMKLEKIVEADGQKSHTWIYTFIPTNEDWKNRIVFRVRTENPSIDMMVLELPVKKNDTILLPWKKDHEQTELEKK